MPTQKPKKIQKNFILFTIQINTPNKYSLK